MTQRKRVLAVASAGGHWQQLMMMRPAFERHEVHFVTTLPGLADSFGATPAHLVVDCNRNEKIAVLRSAASLLWLMLRLRPDVVISTGALPGVLALAEARAVRARTIWVDSVANAEEMSMSGRAARRSADVWLSQWPHVAAAEGAGYEGSVL
jgi:UDP-N-acetylglucosamine:LPS N-acetylglucosamine transferase